MSDDLPIGWVWIQLEDITMNPKNDIVDGPFGSNLKATEYLDSGTPIIRLQNIDRNQFVDKNIKFISSEKANSLKRHSFINGDIVITKLGDPLGKACLVPDNFKEGIIVADIVRVRPDERFVSKLYLLHAINSKVVINQLQAETKGTTRARVNLSHIRQIKIPFSPLNEQRRIVDKLERIGDRQRSARNELNHIPKLIARYKQAVLDAAFRGDLTADWREGNINLRSASELLEKIREEQIKRLSPKNKISTTNGYFDNSVEIDFLPDSWRFCQIGDIGIVCNGSTPSRKMPEYWNGNINWVSSGEVRNNIITTTKESITQEGFDNSSVRMLPSRTILLAMIGEGKTRGQTAILKTKATINQNIAAVIIDHGLVSSEYLWYWFQSQYQITREAGNGSGPQALNCQRVRELSFIFCPLEEQKEIVRRVEKMFEKIDRMEQEYQKAAKLCDRLEQATLAKAFRGELVPQDPDDEPASVLLEQVKREKVKGKKGK